MVLYIEIEKSSRKGVKLDSAVVSTITFVDKPNLRLHGLYDYAPLVPFRS